jgi:branched-chain amino acid transport system ATP-binding protein
MSGTIIIETTNLTKHFGGLCAVNDFSAHLSEQQIIGIIGPNGAGKTTILNMISGVYPPSSGKILFKGQDITNYEPDKVNHLGIARTFQNIKLFQDMTVLETVMTAYSWRAPYNILKALVSWRSVARFEAESRQKALYWIERVGLTQHVNDIAQSLPYGQQRRLEIARALASEPCILLLDEPGAGINHSEIHKLIDLIESLYEELKLSIILIDHRMDVIMRLCSWIYVQDFGKNIAQGTPDQIQKNQVVIKAYLGEDDKNA